MRKSEDEIVPYQTGVCDETCAPNPDRESEGYSQLFKSVYDCWRFNGELDYNPDLEPKDDDPIDDGELVDHELE